MDNEPAIALGDLKPFPADIPLDIARLIFEKAMEERPVPVHIALVSRQVQHWVEPSIYRHLAFRSDKQFELFYRTFRTRRFSLTKPPVFYSRHVKTLYIGCDEPRAEKLCALGRTLTNLSAIAAWDNSWGLSTLLFLKNSDAVQSPPPRHEIGLTEDGRGDEDTDKQQTRPYDYPNLHRLSLSSGSLYLHDITLAHRAFRNTTHLDIYFTHYFEWSSISSLHNLTHLSVDMATLAYPKPTMFETTSWIECITTSCHDLNMLKVIVFACIDDEHVDFDLLDDEGDYLLPPDFDALDTQSTPWPLCRLDADEWGLHPLTRIALGLYHPLVVIGTLTEDLPANHFLEDYLVLFEWPKNVWDWDFSVPVGEHKESWGIAEEIVERRRKAKERAGGALGLEYLVKQRFTTVEGW